jgi:hypothetical protein
MALIKKVEAAATGGTHVIVDGTIVDALMPHTMLGDSTSNFIRSAVYGVGGWVLATRKHTGGWGF